MSPFPFTPTHNDTDGHEIAANDPLRLTTRELLQFVAPPPGFVELHRLPSRSKATHNDTDGHETPARLGAA